MLRSRGGRRVRCVERELIDIDDSLKNANPARQEHARLEVENAEDDLVQKTEVAITLMKTVLENVRIASHTIHCQPKLTCQPARTHQEYQ